MPTKKHPAGPGGKSPVEGEGGNQKAIKPLSMGRFKQHFVLECCSAKTYFQIELFLVFHPVIKISENRC
jgi:hypothetical protein